jgi:hypothetical protein
VLHRDKRSGHVAEEVLELDVWVGLRGDEGAVVGERKLRDGGSA